MGLEKFDPTLAGHDLVQDLKWDPALRAEFKRNEKAVLDRYALRPAERKAIEERDFKALYDLGFHPYLGGQLSRFIYGNDAGQGALVANLSGASSRGAWRILRHAGVRGSCRSGPAIPPLRGGARARALRSGGPGGR
jgi:protocatechuate 4,5-dioxygenase alpha chain